MRIKFLDLVTSPIQFRLYLLTKLPSAFFSGVRVQYVDEEKCIVTIPYKWFSTNPFKSTYFACLSMAAEMSTGILAMSCIYERKPAISMLVVNMQANFVKKATGVTTFICEDGKRIQQMVDEASASGKSTSLTVRAEGKDKDGQLVAEFSFTWSFKVKTSQLTMGND